MTGLQSDCGLYFSTDHLSKVDMNQVCPVKACSNSELLKIEYQKRWQLPYCPNCGIRLHPKSGTFVYHNGQRRDQQTESRLRNIHFQKEFFKRWILDSPHKAETHRLGYETSEDALSWNVFSALLETGRLGCAAEVLIESKVTPLPEPQLFMWGSRVDLGSGMFTPFSALGEARQKFEKEIRAFPTEPDIMLLVPNKLLICIEAKFTSGNPLAQKSTITRSDEKPKTVQALLNRYYDQWPGAAKLIDPSRIDSTRFHSQLFRNIIFAAWMAEKMSIDDWHVVNLVSSTQWARKKARKEGAYDYQDPTASIRDYLKADNKKRFTFSTWENLYSQVINRDAQLNRLAEYLRHKTAFLEPAFELSNIENRSDYAIAAKIPN